MCVPQKDWIYVSKAIPSYWDRSWKALILKNGVIEEAFYQDDIKSSNKINLLYFFMNVKHHHYAKLLFIDINFKNPMSVHIKFKEEADSIYNIQWGGKWQERRGRNTTQKKDNSKEGGE